MFSIQGLACLRNMKYPRRHFGYLNRFEHVLHIVINLTTWGFKCSIKILGTLVNEYSFQKNQFCANTCKATDLI